MTTMLRVGWVTLSDLPDHATFRETCANTGLVGLKRVDQGEAQPCENDQVELILKFSRIIENLTWTI